METIALTKNGLIIEAGKKVKIKALDELKKCLDIAEGMWRRAGTWVTVKEISEKLHCGNKAFTIEEDGLEYMWDETMISASESYWHEIHLSDPVYMSAEPKEEQKIVIWSDGKTSKAKLYENGHNVACVTTERSDGDKHDLFVAATMLMSRLKDATPDAKYWGNAPEEKDTKEYVVCKMVESTGEHLWESTFKLDRKYELRDDELRTLIVTPNGSAYAAKKWQGIYPHYTIEQKSNGYAYTFEKVGKE